MDEVLHDLRQLINLIYMMIILLKTSAIDPKQMKETENQ